MTQPETEESKPYTNPYCPKDEFEKAVRNTPEFEAVIAHILNVLYGNLQNQSVLNSSGGQLLVTSFGVRDPKEGIRPFHFALITENGHVANQPE